MDILSGSIGGQCKIISSLFEDMNSTPIFANALSLAPDIASSEYRHKLINFIPPELKKKRRPASDVLDCLPPVFALWPFSG